MSALSLTSEMPTRHCSPRLRMLARFGCDRIGRAPEAGPTINAVADRELEGEGARFAAAELATPVPHHQVSELFRAAPADARRAEPRRAQRALSPIWPAELRGRRARARGPDRLVVPLAWSLDNGPELFGRFVGAFVVEHDGNGARIRLGGEPRSCGRRLGLIGAGAELGGVVAPLLAALLIKQRCYERPASPQRPSSPSTRSRSTGTSRSPRPGAPAACSPLARATRRRARLAASQLMQRPVAR